MIVLQHDRRKNVFTLRVLDFSKKGFYYQSTVFALTMYKVSKVSAFKNKLLFGRLINKRYNLLAR